MTLPFLNRDTTGKFVPPADGWYHLIPRGEFPAADHDVIQVLDEAAGQAIVNRFSADKAAPNFAGILIDQDHFSYDPDKPSTAYGWIRELQNRADGVWGQVQWTDLGEEAVKNGRYRFISPTWLPGQVEQLGNKRVRPLRLDSAGLTNNPNLRGMVPLSNRRGASAPMTNAGSGVTTPNEKKLNMKSVCAELGLSPDASEEAILQAVKALKGRTETATGEATAMKNRATALETENANIKTEVANLRAAQVEADLAKYGNRFAPEKKETWKQALLTNRAHAIDLLESIPAPAAAGANGQGGNQAAGQQAMHNRAGTTPPGGGADPGKDPEKTKKEEARANRISNRAAEIIKTQKVPYSQAFSMAMGEFPAE